MDIRTDGDEDKNEEQADESLSVSLSSHWILFDV